jgi:hypothetical protein
MSMHRLMILAAAALAPCSFAADSTKPALPQKAGPPLELKNKSSFAVRPGTRNPFLPIGWKGGPLITQALAPRQNTPADAFRLSTIIVGSPSVAVINGKIYSEGQIIKMPKTDSRMMQVAPRVYRILDGAVQIQVGEQLLTVPLSRGKLNEIQPDAPLAPEE